MDIGLARQTVITAGKKLVETGLIARTWGNVSCRIDDSRFAVTPSGMLYETLRPEDIVIVSIDSLRYEGALKPSSEKGIHAEVYRQKPGINFVIHTHQANASVAAVLGKNVDIPDAGSRLAIGERVILAAYGLPGTAKLRRNVAAALKETTGRAVLMSHHGALCFGSGPIEAFQAAQALEDECERFIVPADTSKGQLQRISGSRRSGEKCIFDDKGALPEVDIKTAKTAAGGPVPFMAELHCAIYSARKDVNVITGAAEPHTIAASLKFSAVRPLLDDFAQIIGPSAETAGWEENAWGIKRIVRALKGRNAVLIRGVGALCCTGNEGDAKAAGMVLDKGCKAYLSASAAGAVSPISPAECTLMRYVYLLKYAKKTGGTDPAQ